MYYPEYAYIDDVEIEIPNPYGLPPDPVIEDKNENENGNSYFNKVIKQMYKSHKNEFLFPAPINTSKSMEITKLQPIEPFHKSHFKKIMSRHKSDPTKPSEKKKISPKNSKKAKTRSSSNKKNTSDNN